MRGLSEINANNANPSARDVPGARHTGAADFNWRDFHPDPQAGSGRPTHEDLKARGAFKNVSQEDQKTAQANEAVADLFFSALLIDLVSAAKRGQPARQERIHSAIDVLPDTPFFKFWRRLNAELEGAGKPEAGYRDAKEAFLGGKTPLGAMTFIGKEWDGLRAVPAKPVQYLGGTRPSYHGEFREATNRGTIWHTVTGPSGPILYACPEAALVAAKDAMAAVITARFR